MRVRSFVNVSLKQRSLKRPQPFFGSRIADRGSRIADRGSRIADQGSGIRDQGSGIRWWIVDRRMDPGFVIGMETDNPKATLDCDP
jgi:hypothetical protein